uniref:Nuclear autoantigenic sperm protein n=1 Tax=Spirometra erinaceieuropaei TaxID=99802 RepID=I6TH51_SPIER|nr:nuclear autoantigenic sperm protein [Spirometra erinaceieuropaei]
MAPLDGGETAKSVESAPTAEELIAKGKRDLICLEISSAVENFQKACELIASEHGDFHESLATPNLLYGTALLELARSENHILSEAVGNAESDESDSEVDEDTEEDPPEAKNPPEVLTGEAKGNTQTRATKNTNGEKGASLPVGNVVQESREGSTTENGEVANDSDAVRVESGAPEPSCAAENDLPENKEADEDVSTLQLAWEVVEVAKALFRKHTDSEHQLKVADCLEKLAEISCEKEDHEQAINDLLECLEIRMKHAGENDRLIAETHFQLGVTYSLLNNVHSSDASFATSLDYLNKHKSKLLASLEAQETETDSGKADAHRLELQTKEITQLIKEVEERQKENSDSSACRDVKGDIAPPKPLNNVPPVTLRTSSRRRGLLKVPKAISKSLNWR